MKNILTYFLLLTLTALLLVSCERGILADNRYAGDWTFIVISYYAKNTPFGTQLTSYDSVKVDGKIEYQGSGNNLAIIFAKNEITGPVDDNGEMMCIDKENYYSGIARFENHCLVEISLSHWGMQGISYMHIFGDKPRQTNGLKSKPDAVTTSATGTSVTGARINGIVKANYLFTDVSFQYGLTTSYGSEKTVLTNLFTGEKDTEVYADLSGLTPSTLYHFRVKAFNSSGISYGEDMFFTTNDVSSSSVTDIDNNVYRTITIGTQTWMAENLKTTRYADGTPLRLVKLQDEWNQMPETEKAYCYYGNDTANLRIYGALYNWAGAMNGIVPAQGAAGKIQGACPAGWHIPGENEWNILEEYLGGGNAAGPKLTETGNNHWTAHNTVSNNSTGFTAIPGGRRTSYPYSFLELGQRANFWTSTICYSLSWNPVYWRFIVPSSLVSTTTSRNSGLSIRCVKD